LFVSVQLVVHEFTLNDGLPGLRTLQAFSAGLFTERLCNQCWIQMAKNHEQKSLTADRLLFLSGTNSRNLLRAARQRNRSVTGSGSTKSDYCGTCRRAFM